MILSHDNSIVVSIHDEYLSVIIFGDESKDGPLFEHRDMEESKTWVLSDPKSLTEAEHMIERFVRKRIKKNKHDDLHKIGNNRNTSI